MKKTSCGLADLAKAFNVLRPSHGECAAIARLLGLKGNIAFGSATATQHAAHFPGASLVIPPPKIPIEDEQEDHPLEDTWKFRRPRRWEYERRVEPPSLDEIARPVKLTVQKPPPIGEMPPYVADAEELDFHRGIYRNLSPPELLVPQRQLRALISDLITAPIPGDPDIQEIVAALARGRVPKQLPRRRRRGFARRVHVILDTADPMWLFQRDAVAVVDALHALASNAVQRESITRGPPARKPLPSAANGDTVVILSGLGIGSESPVSAKHQVGWLKFGAFQRRRGLLLVALVPFHHRRWPAKIKRNFRMVHWHRPGIVTALTKQTELHYLACVLSLAAVIDPALLRYARTTILPTSDAGVEADFVNAPWVASHNPRIIVLHPRWTVMLRTELAQDHAAIEAARRLLVEQRPKDESWGRVVCEESLIYLSLQPDSDSQITFQLALGRVIRSLLGRMRDAASARWALYLFEELPEAARQTKAAQLLKAVASVILNTSHDEVADIVADQNVRWIFSESVRIGIRWTGDCIIVCEPPQIYDQILEIPATWPRVVIITTPDESRNKVLRISQWKYGWTRATKLPRLIKTTAGAEYRLDEHDDSQIWEKLERAYKTNQTLVGEVTDRLRGGDYRVDIGVAATMNKNEILTESSEAFRGIIGSILEVRVASINRDKRRVVVTLGPEPPDDIWKKLREKFKARETITGEVKRVTLNDCIVDIGVLSFAPLAELQKEEAENPQNLVGKILEFCIIEISSVKRARILLSRRLDEMEKWHLLEEAKKAKTIIPGIITEAIPGGFSVDVGLPAFLPSEEVESPPSGLERLIGETLRFAVKSVERSRRVVTLSKKDVLKIEQGRKIFSELKIGEIRNGIVKNLTDFGAFVDLNGIDALLHITDMSWGRLNHPSELLKVGQELDVVILDVDKEKKRVSLGLKQMIANPWDKIETKFPIGTKVKGKVVSLVPYGAFVQLEPGVEGLVHVTELSWTKRVAKPSDVLKQDQEVEAVVLGINRDEQKISLGIRQLESNPWDKAGEKYPPGTRVKGIIRNITAYCAFIGLEDGINGMINLSDMSWTRKIKHPSEVMKKGEVVEATVLGVDRLNQRILLGIKQLGTDPWSNIETLYKVGDLVQGKVTKLASFGAFVGLQHEIDSLVHISQISEERVDKIKNVLKVGQDVKARVVNIDHANRRIGLSIKAANQPS